MHRAVDILHWCHAIACEYIRITGKILNHLGISITIARYDDHAGDQVRNALPDRARTEAIAIVSDSGTPLSSDPGYQSVTPARATGVIERLCQAHLWLLPF